MGKTERIDNNLNPDFKTAILVTYKFEQHQKLKFELIDDDGNNSFDLIGSH